jgi:hypothetical protein
MIKRMVPVEGVRAWDGGMAGKEEGRRREEEQDVEARKEI